MLGVGGTPAPTEVGLSRRCCSCAAGDGSRSLVSGAANAPLCILRAGACLQPVIRFIGNRPFASFHRTSFSGRCGTALPFCILRCTCRSSPVGRRRTGWKGTSSCRSIPTVCRIPSALRCFRGYCIRHSVCSRLRCTGSVPSSILPSYSAWDDRLGSPEKSRQSASLPRVTEPGVARGCR